eukprot:bmy_17722T0
MAVDIVNKECELKFLLELQTFQQARLASDCPWDSTCHRALRRNGSRVQPAWPSVAVCGDKAPLRATFCTHPPGGLKVAEPRSRACTCRATLAPTRCFWPSIRSTLPISASGSRDVSSREPGTGRSVPGREAGENDSKINKENYNLISKKDAPESEEERQSNIKGTRSRLLNSESASPRKQKNKTTKRKNTFKYKPFANNGKTQYVSNHTTVWLERMIRREYPYLGTLRAEQDDAWGWGGWYFLSPTRQLISPQPTAARYFGTEAAAFHDGETTGLLLKKEKKNLGVFVFDSMEDMFAHALAFGEFQYTQSNVYRMNKYLERLQKDNGTYVQKRISNAKLIKFCKGHTKEIGNQNKMVGISLSVFVYFCYTFEAEEVYPILNLSNYINQNFTHELLIARPKA